MMLCLSPCCPAPAELSGRCAAHYWQAVADSADAALEAERAAHAHTREVLEATRTASAAAEKQLLEEPAERERAEAEGAAMREVLDQAVRECSDTDMSTWLPLDLRKRAEAALKCDAGSALLASHRAEVERVERDRDGFREAKKEGDEALHKLLDKHGVWRRHEGSSAWTVYGRIDRGVEELRARLERLENERDIAVARIQQLLPFANRPSYEVVAAERDAARAEVSNLNAELRRAVTSRDDNHCREGVTEILLRAERVITEQLRAQLVERTAERDALKDDLENERARHSLACAALDEVKATIHQAADRAAVPSAHVLQRLEWMVTAGLGLVKERDAERARADAAVVLIPTGPRTAFRLGLDDGAEERAWTDALRQLRDEGVDVDALLAEAARTVKHMVPRGAVIGAEEWTEMRTNTCSDEEMRRRVEGARAFIAEVSKPKALPPDWIERAREASAAMTDADKEVQRRSFAYGNAAIENPNVTREMVDEAADRIAGARDPDPGAQWRASSRHRR